MAASVEQIERGLAVLRAEFPGPRFSRVPARDGARYMVRVCAEDGVPAAVLVTDSADEVRAFLERHR